MSPRISAVVNTLNEGRNIRSCLESLRWCDEIIVVDMQSDDDTVQVASEFTDRIYTHERVGYVEPARKFAVEKATGDWIVVLDADELVTASLRDRLLAIAREDSWDVVHLPRKNYIMGAWIRHTGWWPDYQARFFKRGAVTFSDKIHSQFLLDPKCRQTFLPPVEENGIEHFSYKDSEEFLARTNRYTTVEAAHMFREGKPVTLAKILLAGLGEFRIRYVSCKGYQDGYRGFFLSAMMGFYRFLTYMKLWERHQNEGMTVDQRYEKLKESILKQHSRQ